MSKTPITKDDKIENVEVALSKTEQFIERNQKTLSIFVAVLVVLVGGYYAYVKLYLHPLETEAQKLIYTAQLNFERSDFQLALDGDGVHPGFLEIIDQYGQTKVGNLSRYYAGISFLHLGDFESAIEYLKKFKTRDPELSSISSGVIGDAYLELGNKKSAITWYTKAVSYESPVTAPFFLLKKGWLHEAKGENKEALEAFQTIKDKYQNSNEAHQVDKYITRVMLK